MTDTDDPRPLIAGVCGFPISQSKSPFLFRHWFETYGISGSYTPLRVAAEDFESVIPALIKAGFRGVNCTIPHKINALGMADSASEAAKAIGAANTLTFSKGGLINADNTDWYGFIQNVQHGCPDWNPADGPALMLGAGGAARAGIFALLEAGCRTVRLTNRTREKAEALADFFGQRVQVIDWRERAEALEGVSIIANSTSLGMVGGHPLTLALDAAPQKAMVTDMVYNPLETDLLRQARERGMPTVDGLGMLLHQARPGFRAWFGHDPEVTPALRRACLGGSA
jgi:shikimate dehydrogenase